MNVLRIKELVIKNFKGITAFNLFPDGKITHIYGGNGTGKTTLKDLVLWVFFGKDSTGKSDFQIKPTDKDNNEKHKIETSGEIVLDLSGDELTLKKVYREKWTKERGKPKKEFTGHITDYWINGVPSKKKEYDSKVSDIIDQKIFKLLTDPYEFNNIKWEDRRKMLFDISDSKLTDSDVAEKMYGKLKDKTNLNFLLNILNNSSIEDHKKIVAQKKRDINKEIEKIPIKIDENHEKIKEIEGVDLKKKADLEKQSSGLQEELIKIKSNEMISEKKIELSKVEKEIVDAKTKHQKHINEKTKSAHAEINVFQTQIDSGKRKISSTDENIDKNIKRIAIVDETLSLMRSSWSKTDKSENTCKTECPACKQELPEDEVEAAIEKFNSAKAENLKKITSDGKNLRAGNEQRKIDIANDEKSISDLHEEIKGLRKQIDEKQEFIDNVDQSNKLNLSGFEKKKTDIQELINGLESGTEELEKECQELIDNIKSKISNIETLEAEHRASEKSKTRIEELEKEEKDLSKKFEEIESELFILEKFDKKKVEMFEDDINSKFELAKFKLFDVQINGGINPCCETLFDGIPYSKGLNSAMRINVGLDVISTLSKHYGLSAPIFIDNAESINEIIPMNTQVITLSVSDDKKLVIK